MHIKSYPFFRKVTVEELGTAPLGRVMFHYALPMMITMSATNIYQLVANYFVGQYCGATAISALVLCYPFTLLLNACSVCVGLGASVVGTRLLGQQNGDMVLRVVRLSVLLGIVAGLLFTMVPLLLLTPMLQLFGGRPELLPDARDFILPVILVSLPTILNVILSSQLRIESPHSVLSLNVTSVVLHIFLEWLLVGYLAMGIRGSGYGIAAIELFRSVILLWLFLTRNRHVRLYFRLPQPTTGEVIPQSQLLRRIISNGMPQSVMLLTAVVLNSLVNAQFAVYSTSLAIGAFGICNRYLIFLQSFIHALSASLQPIAAYNYGARQMDRVRQAWQMAVRLSVVVMVVLTVLTFLFAPQIVSIFTSHAVQQEIATQGLRILVVTLPVVAWLLNTNGLMIAIGLSRKAMLVVALRQVFFILPLVYFLPMYWGGVSIWVSYALTDILLIPVVWVISRRIWRQLEETVSA